MNSNHRTSHPIVWSLVLTGLLTSVGCSFTLPMRGSGVSKTESRELAAFSQIKIGGFASVVVTIDPNKPQSLSITTDDNLLPLVETTVAGEVLTIDEKQNIAPTHGLKIEISVHDLSSGQIDGSGDLIAHGVAGKSFHASVSGSGDVKLDGNVDSIDASISGSGDIDTLNLTAQSASVSITGSGDAKVNATTTLDAQVTGSGDIRYTGSPKVNQQVTGSGSVKQHK